MEKIKDNNNWETYITTRQSIYLRCIQRELTNQEERTKN